MKNFRQMRKESLDDVSSFSHRRLSTILKDPAHPHHAAAKAEMDRRGQQQEGAMKRIVTTQSNKADRMASTDKKGLETYKKKIDEYGGPKLSADKVKKMRTPQMKVDEISLDMLTKKISNSGMKSTKKAMGADKTKKDLEAMKARLNKMKPVAEKTLTSAEKKKREEIAQAMERDNPGMDKSKKMAIATATAKRVAEETVNELKRSTLSNYMRASSADVAKSRGDAKRQDKRIGGQKTADEKIRKSQGYGSSATVAATNEEKDTHVTKDGRTVKKGLWYYMNKRKQAGKSRPKSAGTVDPEAMKRSQK